MTFLSQTVIGARFRIQFYPRPGQLRSIVGFNPINRPLPAVVESHDEREAARALVVPAPLNTPFFWSVHGERPAMTGLV